MDEEYIVVLKHKRTLRYVRVHVNMSWLELSTIYKYVFNLPYTGDLVFFDDIGVINFHINETLKYSLKDKKIFAGIDFSE